ncbi:MAG TPA: hypothetical protein GX700_16180 [Paracoccus sp.]|nr:hypothetical protein [Paracoccus sp. (in: a-proteobacteria)]
MSNAPEDHKNDLPLDALLRQLNDHIRHEELPDEIGKLARQLETALQRRRREVGGQASDGALTNPSGGAARGCCSSS